MLAELYALSDALRSAGIAPQRTHPRVKAPGRAAGPAIRVRLDPLGRVTALERIVDDEWPGLWTIMEGNQNSFPVVRVKEPLLVPVAWSSPSSPELATKRASSRDSGERRHSLLTALEQLPTQTLSENGADLWNRLREQKAAEIIGLADVPELQSICALAKRFHAATEDIELLLDDICSTARQQLDAGWDDSLDLAQALFIGNGKGATLAQLAFDLDAPSGTIYSSQCRSVLTAYLPASAGAATHNSSTAGTCAYTGAAGSLLSAPFPKVRLPILNRDFPLASMFEEAACNERYGLSGSRVIPVAEETARALQDALTYVVSPEREGKTWRGVASGRFETLGGRRTEKRDLLIAYVEQRPQLEADLVSIFAAGPRTHELAFTTAAQPVCDALEGVVHERPDSHLNLFVLHEASLGQAQVALSDSPTVKEVIEGARWWQAAAANIPEVSLPIPSPTGGPVRTAPRSPHPDQLVRILSRHWVVRGTRELPAFGASLRDVLDVMLLISGRRAAMASHLLDLALERTHSLLEGAFAASIARRLEDYSAPARRAALEAISALGILLYALGRPKETYMESPAFMVGQFLALADLLHREYCVKVRNNSIPPQLIGNAVFPIASQKPRVALERLADRMRVYQAWAYRTEASDKDVRETLQSLGEIAARLQTVPAEMGSQERAELLLGYVSRASTETKGANQ